MAQQRGQLGLEEVLLRHGGEEGSQLVLVSEKREQWVGWDNSAQSCEEELEQDMG